MILAPCHPLVSPPPHLIRSDFYGRNDSKLSLNQGDKDIGRPGDTADSIPNHINKMSIAKKGDSHEFFDFPVQIKVMFTL